MSAILPYLPSYPVCCPLPLAKSLPVHNLAEPSSKALIKEQ